MQIYTTQCFCKRIASTGNEQLSIEGPSVKTNLSCLPVPDCPCWKSGVVSVTQHCRSSAGLRTASLSTLEDLLEGTRTRREPWKWPGGPCKLLLSLLQTEAAADRSERTANSTVCSGLQSVEKTARIKMLVC